MTQLKKILYSRLTGTQAIRVGFRMETSPLAPFLIAVEASDKVLGLE